MWLVLFLSLKQQCHHDHDVIVIVVVVGHLVIATTHDADGLKSE